MADKITFKVNANDVEFIITPEQIAAVDLVQKSPFNFNLLINKRSVNATLIHADFAAKQLCIEIEGERYEVCIHDALDQLLSEMGFDQIAVKQIKEIKAPMPGLVLEIAVTAGQDVAAGDKILILGAMKMENCITIPAEAVIKRINVAVGQSVEKGQVMIELE